MTRWTESDLLAYQAKYDALRSPAHDADPGPESELQAKITKYCDSQAWPVLSFPQTQAVRKFLPAGWPDQMILIVPQRRWVFLEIKAGKGRLSEEQKQMAIRFLEGGHKIYEVRSFKRFLEIVMPGPIDFED